MRFIEISIVVAALLGVTGCTGQGGSGGWGGQGIQLKADNNSRIEEVHITITDGGTDLAGGLGGLPALPAQPAPETTAGEDEPITEDHLADEER